MNAPTCPGCGHPADHHCTPCGSCGQGLNGQQPPGRAAPTPLPVNPIEIPDGRLASEHREWERPSFDREAFLAGLREVEQTGGVRLKDFLHELEQRGPSGE